MSGGGSHRGDGGGGKNRDLAGYDYKAMSSKVIETDRKHRARPTHTGEPESLKNHLAGLRMGSRVSSSGPKKPPAANADRSGRNQSAGDGAGKTSGGGNSRIRRRNAAAAPEPVLPYYPRTAETRRAHEVLLDLVRPLLGDQPAEVVHAAVAAVARVMRRRDITGGASSRIDLAAEEIGCDRGDASARTALGDAYKACQALVDFDQQIERWDAAGSSSSSAAAAGSSSSSAAAAGGGTNNTGNNDDDDVAVVFDDDEASGEGSDADDLLSEIDPSYYSSSGYSTGSSRRGSAGYYSSDSYYGSYSSGHSAAGDPDASPRRRARRRRDSEGSSAGSREGGGSKQQGHRRGEKKKNRGQREHRKHRKKQAQQQQRQRQRQDQRQKHKQVPARDIDAHFVQRTLSVTIEDPNDAHAKAEAVLACLADTSKDDRECEIAIVAIVGYEAFDAVRLLLRNRERVVLCVRLARAGPSGQERETLEAEISQTAAGAAIVRELHGDKGDAGKKGDGDVGDDDNDVGGGGNDGERMAVDGGAGAETGAPASAAAGAAAAGAAGADAPPPVRRPRVLNLTAMAFAEGGHTMTNQKCDLPGSVLTQRKGFEEVRVPPATVSAPGGEDQVLVSIAEDVPEWARPAFKGITKLNPVQSKVYDYALFSADNMLLCAPTGAGKTNVAMLTMLGEIGRHIVPGSGGDGAGPVTVDTSAFKIVYVAPMKALVQEMVASFGRRLKPLGISVRELTGDMSLTRQEIADTQVIVTTPEKWDIVTRKNGDRTYTALVNLVIVDEIHLLHDARGPVLESLVARTIRGVESTGRMVRIVGLSATLPNYEDVRLLLRVPEGGLFHFGPEYRPVPLEQVFVGITERSPLKRHRLANDACYARVAALDPGAQILVFVHSRKETVRTARYLRDRAQEEGRAAAYLGDEATRATLDAEASRAQSPDLRDLLPYGFAVHHAGMARSDRTLVEDLYARRKIQVLVSTATLAWGVNLPAHEVVIKGTQVYDPEKGRWGELSFLDVMQMVGRAGRPGFDSRGVGVIITGHAELQYYLSLFNAQLPIESQLVSRLPDQLNAEVVLGTIATIDDAAEWLGYSYLYVRAMRNPQLYGVELAAIEDDPDLLQWRRDLAHTAALQLDASGLVRYDRRAGRLASTDAGRVSAHYYVSHATMRAYRDSLRAPMGIIDLIGVFARSGEFANVTVRPEERVELERLAALAPIPAREAPDHPAAKISVLLQAYVTRLPLEGLTLAADMVYVKQSAARLLRALWEIIVRRGWARLAEECLTLCRCAERGMWQTMSPLRQFPAGAVPADAVRRLEGRAAALGAERLREVSAAEIGELVRDPSAGEKIKNLAQRLPRMDLACEVQPVTRTLLRVELRVTPDFAWDSRYHGSTERWWIFVVDGDGERILHYEPLLVKAARCMDEHVVEFTVPVSEPVPPLYFVRAISDRWLGCDAELPVSFRHLILPARFPAPTPHLDVQRATVRVHGREVTLTSALTQARAALAARDGSALFCATRSEGRDLAVDVAVSAALERDPRARIVVVTALAETAARRVRSLREAGVPCVALAGRAAEDARAVNARGEGAVVVARAAHWEPVSRRWKQRAAVRATGLLVAEDVHLLGRGADGAALEVCVSRARHSTSARIVATGGPVANANDIAGWIDAAPQASFAFAAPPAAEIVVKGFDIDHSPTRVEAMLGELAKPWILGAAGAAASLRESGASVLVFAPTRGAANRIEAGAIEGLAGSNSAAGLLRAEVDPWSGGSADTVVILDTLRYDGRERRHAELPVADLLEMAGRARRRCVVLCHSRRKGHLKRFMRDPLPVESHLDHFFADHLNGEIAARNVEEMQDAVDYLTWTLLYRRLAHNPNYYGLRGVSDTHLSNHVSELVETSVSALAEAGCAATSGPDGLDLVPTNLGLIASFYSLGHEAAELLDASLEAGSRLAGIAEIVAAALEAEVPVRRGESLAVSRLAKAVPLGLGASASEDPARAKALVLLQCHFSRVQLGEAHGRDLATDRDALVRRVADVLVPAVVDVASSHGWYRPALEAMELAQMCACRMWADESPLWQLPHANKELVARAPRGTGVLDILDLEDDDRTDLFAAASLSADQVAEIAEYCNAFPNPELVHTPRIDDASGALVVDAVVQDDVEEGAAIARWYVVVGVPAENALVAIKACETNKPVSLRVERSRRLSDPTARYTIALVARDHMGADQAFEFADPDPKSAAADAVGMSVDGEDNGEDEYSYESYGSEDGEQGQQQQQQQQQGAVAMRD